MLISFTALVSIDEGVLLECYYMLLVGGGNGWLRYRIYQLPKICS